MFFFTKPLSIILFSIIIFLLETQTSLSDITDSFDLNSININENISEFGVIGNTVFNDYTRKKPPEASHKNYDLLSFSFGSIFGRNNQYSFDLNTGEMGNGNFSRESGKAKYIKTKFGLTSKKNIMSEWVPFIKIGYMNLDKLTLNCIETEKYLVGSKNIGCSSNTKDFLNISNPVSYKSESIEIDTGIIKRIENFKERTIYKVGILNKYLDTNTVINSLVSNYIKDINSQFGQSSNWQEQAVYINLNKVYLLTENLSIGIGLKSHKDFNKNNGKGFSKNIELGSKMSFRISKSSYLSLGGNYNVSDTKFVGIRNHNFFENDHNKNIYLNFGYIQKPPMINEKEYK